MNPTGKKWLLGCGIGCGAVILLGILITVGGSLFMMGPFRDAIATREALDELYGDQASFTPPADGAVTADRVEAFLTVRDAIMELCADFQQTAAQFQAMDDLDEDANDREAMAEGFKLTREVIGMVPRMGKLYEARNVTLGEVEMGLGEYTYIYVMAYGREINPEDADDETVFGDKMASRRVREILRDMLRRQLNAALDADAQGQDLDDLRDRLVAEIEILEAEPERLPWQDGLPPAVAASLAPFRDRLDAGFCRETSGLELNQNQQRGLSIQGS